MLINNTSAAQYQTIQQQSPSAAISTEPKTGAPTASTRTTISESAQQLLQTERDIVSKYDVRNMSPVQMKTMAGELKDNGLISDGEHLDMTFEFRFDKQLGSNYNENKPINYLQQFQARLDSSKAHGGNQAHNDMLQNMMGLLQRYDNL
ncbi:MAG: hypothetical protein ACI8WB_002157 [Phenylobacterium sp.]|jgi:hypothetical protein